MYLCGIEVGYIKAGSHNAAEKKAQKKAAKGYKTGTYRGPYTVSVTYTEV